jgi:co-chaperonin GroES (HSP10)
MNGEQNMNDQKKQEIDPGPGLYLVKPIDRPDTTPQGIVIPSSYRGDDEPNMGEVVKVGPATAGYSRRFGNAAGEPIPMFAKEGDTILYHTHNITPVRVDGYEFILVDNGSILGWVR